MGVFHRLQDHETVKLLTKDQLDQMYERITAWYRYPPGRIVAEGEEIDESVTDLLLDELVQRLEQLPIAKALPVNVVVNSRDGASMSWTALMQHFDELWAPARDDLLVVSLEHGWLLFLSHEEQLSLVRFSPAQNQR